MNNKTERTVALLPGYGANTKIRNKQVLQRIEQTADRLLDANLFFMKYTVTPFDSSMCTYPEAWERLDSVITNIKASLIEAVHPKFILINIEQHRDSKTKKGRKRIEETFGKPEGRLIHVKEDHKFVPEGKVTQILYPHLNIQFGISKYDFLSNKELKSKLGTIETVGEASYSNFYSEAITSFITKKTNKKTLVGFLEYNLKEFRMPDLRANISQYFTGEDKTNCFLDCAEELLPAFSEVLNYFNSR